jgi:restriction system protein
MARKKDPGIFEMLMELPWWVGVIVAAIAYVLIAAVAPRILSGNAILKSFVGICPAAAKMVALLCLVAAGVSAIRSWSRRRLLDGQKGIETIRALSWPEFENLVGEAYRRQGYAVEETGGGGADGGVDLILRKGSEKTVVQCKRWRERQVGVNVVRELYGVMVAEGAVRGIIVSSGTFTPDATTFASGKSLTLVDGPALEVLVGSVQKATIPAAMPPPAAANSTACPTCGKPMVLRTAKKGDRAGTQFWGCSQYPACRGIRNIP